MEFDPKWLTDPQVFQVNRLPAHASYMVRGADGAPLEQTLDGAWKFFYAQTPGASPQEFYREGYDVSGWDEIAVPGYIQLQGGGKYGTPHYVNTQYPWDGHERLEPPAVPERYNPVGCYVRGFAVPQSWDGPVCVRFDGVDFAYEEGKTILHDISLFAKPGQKLAFVGATGAGKTTITNLINRFYDIADGKIRYDGISINNIRKPDLRRSLGIVLQDTNLFTGTVRENIRYGNLDATDEEVEAAAALANADDFIRRLPQGYDTMLTGNGANLSQGQRQLLAIARAAVADPPVMILDEATSSIDTRTEAIVQQGMDSLMYGRTVFVIAHRLSTVRNSNAIMVLDHGRIVERGDHEDLIRQHGLYYQLYTGAFELE